MFTKIRSGCAHDPRDVIPCCACDHGARKPLSISALKRTRRGLERRSRGKRGKQTGRDSFNSRRSALSTVLFAARDSCRGQRASSRKKFAFSSETPTARHTASTYPSAQQADCSVGRGVQIASFPSSFPDASSDRHSSAAVIKFTETAPFCA